MKIMKNTLTREELIKAKEAFWCEDWKNPIQEILESTKNKTIEIDEKYLDLIKEDAIWKQINYCKSLNLDLKMNLLKDAKEFVLEKLKACEVVKFDEIITLYQENGKNIFLLDSKHKEFWFDYDEIGKVLEEKYSLKYNEIRELMNRILEEYLKLEGYIPNIDKVFFTILIERKS